MSDNLACQSKKREFFSILTAFGVVFFLLFIILPIISAASSCYTYTSNSTCTTSNGCLWKSDSWGGYCQDLNCWGLTTQSSCTTTNVPGKNCSFNPGQTNTYCQEVSCWSFSGTSDAQCTNNSAGKSCQWSSQCYSSGSGGTGCYNYKNQTSCSNSTGCAWGQCYEKGCSSYGTSSSCTVGKDWRGNNCTWTGSSCKENNCWDTNLYKNETSCKAAVGINCGWKDNSCQELNCWKFDYTNATACTNNSLGLSCSWSGSWCSTSGCWNKNTNESCSASTQCNWKTYTSSGWCTEISCWQWSAYNAEGGENSCIQNSTKYNLGCVWKNNTGGNGTNSGWCEKDYTAVGCRNKTTERDCSDSYYCWWQAKNFSDSSKGGTCVAPGGFGSGGTNTTILNIWNPKCYVFDNNQTDCNTVLGCSYSNGKCSEASNSYGTNISSDGIKCSYINDSSLCNGVPVLSSCCSWSGGACADAKLTTSCWNNLAQTPNGEDSCEDGKTKSGCDKLAGSPWYMPCKWDNSSSTPKCAFKAEDVFGNGSFSLVKIENKKNCEAAGGNWITENYCQGNISVPSGKCEYKFDSEDNCDKACFACEKKDGDGNSVNSTNALSACTGSDLGICDFSKDTKAPNGIGYCKAKEEWKKGIAGNCDKSCGDCNFKGNPNSNDTSQRPSYYCAQSKANADNGGCKWITDNSTKSGGYCLNKGDKTCLEACDRCNTQTSCTTLGRTSISNQTGSCKWQGSANDGSCVTNVAGDVEICWDGSDNDKDGLIDCADSGCYADSYCGLVSGDCSGWKTNNTCVDNSCEWVSDKWGSWCDFKGSQCWKQVSNETLCSTNSACSWSNGTGGGFCERDWTLAETCFGLNRTTCSGDCSWTNDTWCDSSGKGTDWCNTKGGFCDHKDFKPKNCWNYNIKTSCGNVTGCSWQKDQWSKPQCEVNWSNNCWSYNANSTCSAVTNCRWRNESFSSGTSSAWCENSLGVCWNKGNKNDCTSVSGNICSWVNSSWGGSCQPACQNSTLSSSSSLCGQVQGCIWKEESGWCQEQQANSCFNSTLVNDQSACSAASGCRWKNPGWCGPKNGGFSCGAGAASGGVNSQGSECYKYDGNKTLCTNKAAINVSCGWTDNFKASCEVNFRKDCWKYTSITGGCDASNGCWFKNDSSGSWCTNLADQCWGNKTIQNDQTACNANAYCNYTTTNGCQSVCFSKTSESGCQAVNNSACNWVSGWCTASNVNNLFNNIQSGEPSPLAGDGCGSDGVTQGSVDVCGLGMRDMGEAFGFGVKVRDFTNSSVCNKEKIVSPTSITQVTGNGNESVALFVYLDTDGSSSGGCALSNNVSAEGYEFRFRYGSEWNATKDKAVEAYNAYKCENSKWVATDIKISSWRKIMCSEIGGPIVAVAKSELSRFPTLYDSKKDMRVYAATIGNLGNATYPSDTVGPGLTTPGSVDFDIKGAFEYGADTAKFENILRKGFVQGEDCFNSFDDDGDGNTDCNDWDCQYSSICSDKGVNAADYVDTSSPLVTGVKIEEYTDSALIMYDTNKPTNGSINFYGNDSRCSTLNKSVFDIGILSSNVRDYKLWHSGNLYNGADSLGYALNNNTKYYYKMKVCDSGGKCSVSKCSSFTTAASLSKCGYCNFVTRLQAPSGWNVAYDTDQDGSYEHLQGAVCGTNAGMKTNYSDGRKVNIILNKSDGSIYFEFLNATLTKTGLNSKVSSISGSGAIITGVRLAGLNSDTRDKIVNNFYPEVCRVKIPNEGSCIKLYHCDDNGQNCTDRTALAGGAPVDSKNCVWNAPNCEFSTYTTALSDSGSGGGSGSSGGGGGGGGVTVAPVTAAENATNNTQSSASNAESSPSSGSEAGNAEKDNSNTEIKEDKPSVLSKTAKTVGISILGILVALIVIAAVAAMVSPEIRNHYKFLRAKSGVKVSSGNSIKVK